MDAKRTTSNDAQRVPEQTKVRKEKQASEKIETKTKWSKTSNQEKKEKTKQARTNRDKRTTRITPIAREAVLHALVTCLLGGGGAGGGGCALGVPRRELRTRGEDNGRGV
jgi:hypothetical protein